MENKKIEKKEETTINKEDKKGEEKKGVLPQWRSITILTDGNQIKVDNPQVAGRLEMIAILKEVLKFYEK